MIKPAKLNIFALILFTTIFQSLQCHRPSTWQMFITLVFGEEQIPLIKLLIT